ncbi:hypothetical protein, partial [Methanobrevibacter sp.]|uniref:hypothetical protein n=1 Tax=Methanobrevibacter sp. TaxID=66852 RepID=UPI00388DBEBD
VVVTDVLPAGLIYIKDDSNGKYKNNVWTIGTLESRAFTTLEITTEVVISNANITNVAVVTSDTHDPNETNNEDNDTIEVPPMADVEVTKVVSIPEAFYGDEITWTITVVNHGPDDAVNVVVNDNLPAGLIYVSDDGNGAYDSKTGLWKVGDLHSGRGLVLNIVAKVSVSNTSITNVAVVTSDTYDPNETNNKDNDTVEVNPIVDLVIKKSVDNHNPKIGDIIVWTVTVTNNGPDTAVNAVMRDVIPAGLIFVDSDGNYADNVWTIGDLANGSSATLRIRTQVNVTDAVITNVANVTSDTPDSDLTNNNDSATIDVGHEADLSIQKIVSNPTPNKGDIITWTIFVINNGPDRAVDVVVTDVLPAGLIYIKDDSNGKYKNNVWTIGTLESRTFTTLEITTEVAISNANITNVAVVTSDTYDPDKTNNEDNDTIEVPPMADVEIAKVASVSQAYYGDEVNWTIVVFNKGPDTAVNVIVEDVLPAGLVYVSDDGEGAYDSKTGIWKVGNLSAKEWAALNIVSKVVAYNTNVTNIANVTSDTYDPDKTNNEDNDTVETKPLTDLSVVKTSDKDEYFVGDIAIWTVTVYNAANGTDATKVYIDDFFPSDFFEIISWTVSEGTFKRWIGNEYMWEIDSMGNGTDATLTIVSRAKAPRGEIYNFVQTFCKEDEWNYENNLDDKSVDVVEIPNPVKTVDNAEPYYHEEILYNLTIINVGTTVYTNNLTVVDSLPAGLEFVGVDGVTGAEVVSFDESTLTWVLTNIDSKAPAVITVRAKVNEVGSLTNNLTVVGPDGTTKTVNCTINVPFADLEVVKFVSNGTVHKGDAVVWIIAVTNNGPNLAENVYVIDILPRGLIFVGADGDYNPATGIWAVGDLDNGESKYLVITTIANITNANVTNVAVVNSTTHDPDLTNNKANNTTSIPPEADIGVVKQVDARESVKDQIVEWTITMSNKGPDSAENVLVKDNLPDTLIFISADGDYDPATGIWTIDYLASGEVRVLHIITKVNTTNEVIVNNVSVTSGTYDPDMENNKANNTTKVGPLADLEIVKIVSNSNPHKGDVITWTIAVMNIGPDMAEDVTVSDKLPAGLIFVGSDGDYDPATGIWTVGTLNNGEFKFLVITTIVNITNANVTNVAVVNSTTPDSNETNNRDNDTAEIEPEADIVVIKYVSDQNPVEGDIITWTVVVTNNGPDMAEDVSVAENLPAGLKLISARGSKGAYENGIWTVGDLNNDDVEVLVLTTQVTASSGVIENIVVATSSTYDPNETNNRDNESVTPEPSKPSADLEIVKKANVEKVKVGDKIVWTITVINHGPGVAKNVRVADVAMGDIEYISSGASKGLFDPVSGIWIIGDMENGESAVLTLEFKALSAGTVINAAVVVSDTPDPNEDNNKDKSVVIVEPVSPAPAAAKSPVSEAPATMHATGNPIVMVLLALLAVVGVTLRRKD